MSELRWTKGNWSYAKNEFAGSYFGREDVWEVGTWGSSTGIALVPAREANAQLIASAPELYELLEEVTNYILAPSVFTAEERLAMWDRIEAGLRKARGEA